MSALRRIFKLCDTNKDGILDAAELNEFQVRLQSRLFDTAFPTGYLSENASTLRYSHKSWKVSKRWSRNMPRAAYATAV